jgi:D-glycero-alpha-D-manno-heptose 1-phosphate guanylyltransferase
MIEAIILAGGQGTRLREVVSDLPKSMAPIIDRPFLEILLLSLSSRGFQRVILALGFMADKIRDYFGDSFAGMQLVSIVENTPLGTGGAVRLAMQNVLSDHVYILNGDTYLEFNPVDVESLWNLSKRPIIVGCMVEDTARYGRLLLDQGKVKGFTEKGIAGPGLINAGCYVMPSGQLDHYPKVSVFSLEQDVLVPLVNHTQVEAFQTKGLFIDIGVPADYLLAQTLLANLHR